jgi:hypothetical protein
VLKGTELAQDVGVRFARGPNVKPKHDAAYWAKVTSEFDFSDADRVPPAKFNRVLWTGLMGGRRYPAVASRWASSDADD